MKARSFNSEMRSSGVFRQRSLIFCESIHGRSVVWRAAHKESTTTLMCTNAQHADVKKVTKFTELVTDNVSGFSSVCCFP